MEARHVIAYGLIILLALAGAALVAQWRHRSRAHRRAMRGRAGD
ncbi:hypothetical protein [Tsuneonella sp. SYSU-LHT278]